jgi:tetrapyrrole methylase family protein/MazG family protein
MTKKGISIVGLGPGEYNQLTGEASLLLESSDTVYFRTREHPVFDQLTKKVSCFSFDERYETAQTFEDVYESIVAEVLNLGKQDAGIVYAVPGNPFICEATTPEIISRAYEENIQVRVVVGLSFLDSVFADLKIDPCHRFTVTDALVLNELFTPDFSPNYDLIVGQVYSKRVANNLKLVLSTVYPDEHKVTFVHNAGTPTSVVEKCSLYQIDQSPHIGIASSLFVPALDIFNAFEALQEVVARLRGPEGCPWDRKQTHDSLRPYLLEETYEVLDAIESGDMQELQEELGDLLLQVVLHAQIAGESGYFQINRVIELICRKLISRHPHVFGELEVTGSDEVLVNWEKLKSEEHVRNGKARLSVLDGIGRTLPALLQAEQIQERVVRVGFDWQDIHGVVDKVKEELDEVETAASQGERSDEIGDLLFSIVNLARWLEVDPESALRQTNNKFRTRFSAIEKFARTNNIAIEDLGIERMEEIWQNAKIDNNSSSE